MKQTTLKRKQQRTEAIKNKVCIYQGFTSKSWQQKMENYSCLDLRYIDGRVGVAIGNLFSSFSIGPVKGTRFFSSHWFLQNWWSLLFLFILQICILVSDEFPFCCTWLDLQERRGEIRWPMISSSHFYRLLTVHCRLFFMLLFIEHFCHLSPSLSVFWKERLWHFWETQQSFSSP